MPPNEHDLVEAARKYAALAFAAKTLADAILELQPPQSEDAK